MYYHHTYIRTYVLPPYVLLEIIEREEFDMLLAYSIKSVNILPYQKIALYGIYKLYVSLSQKLHNFFAVTVSTTYKSYHGLTNFFLTCPYYYYYHFCQQDKAVIII